MLSPQCANMCTLTVDTIIFAGGYSYCLGHLHSDGIMTGSTYEIITDHE